MSQNPVKDRLALHLDDMVGAAERILLWYVVEDEPLCNAQYHAVYCGEAERVHLGIPVEPSLRGLRFTTAVYLVSQADEEALLSMCPEQRAASPPVKRHLSGACVPQVLDVSQKRHRQEVDQVKEKEAARKLQQQHLCWRLGVGPLGKHCKRGKNSGRCYLRGQVLLQRNFKNDFETDPWRGDMLQYGKLAALTQQQQTSVVADVYTLHFTRQRHSCHHGRLIQVFSGIQLHLVGPISALIACAHILS
mmetsp:Transcript_8054/g.24251  ORF Transcript_8054/g.24251 Transcript_8054/m.24251 type:complete len:248 (+) Transcript_8054:1882-2625(+)